MKLELVIRFAKDAGLGELDGKYLENIRDFAGLVEEATNEGCANYIESHVDDMDSEWRDFGQELAWELRGRKL